MNDRKKIGEKHTKNHTYGVYEEYSVLTMNTTYIVYDETKGTKVAGPFDGKNKAYDWIDKQKFKGK